MAQRSGLGKYVLGQLGHLSGKFLKLALAWGLYKVLSQLSRLVSGPVTESGY